MEKKYVDERKNKLSTNEWTDEWIFFCEIIDRIFCPKLKKDRIKWICMLFRILQIQTNHKSYRFDMSALSDKDQTLSSHTDPPYQTNKS